MRTETADPVEAPAVIQASAFVPEPAPPAQPGPEGGNGDGRQPPVGDPTARALADLRKAAVKRNPEEICTAYQTLRKVLRGAKLREVFERIRQVLGEAAMDLVVSAYVHRKCFMCKEGVITCDSCAGSGYIEEGRPCPHCDGLGVSPCGFCRGTGWADADLAPSELQKAVALRKLAHIRKDLKRLTQVFQDTPPERLEALGQRERKELALRLMRVQARLRVMAESPQEGDADESRRLLDAAGRLDAYLNALGVSAWTTESEEDDDTMLSSEADEPEGDAEQPAAGDSATGEYHIAEE